MKLSDIAIVKWGDAIVKLLIVFAIFYICVMFSHVETHHVSFSQAQIQLIENNSNAVNLIKDLKSELQTNRMFIEEMIKLHRPTTDNPK